MAHGDCSELCSASTRSLSEQVLLNCDSGVQKPAELTQAPRKLSEVNPGGAQALVLALVLQQLANGGLIDYNRFPSALGMSLGVTIKSKSPSVIHTGSSIPAFWWQNP